MFGKGSRVRAIAIKNHHDNCACHSRIYVHKKFHKSGTRKNSQFPAETESFPPPRYQLGALATVLQRDSWLARLRYFQNATYIRIFMLAEAFEVEWLIVYEEFCFLHFN